MKTICLPIFAVLTAMTMALTGGAASDYPVKPVPFTAVHVTDQFWAPKIETNRKVTIPFAFRKDEETGRWQQPREPCLP